ncbi:MAG: EAL domain-containing protein [Gammaproteobacteria bacterium]|nr:EAL domain-containing protein [Gammaproteobacteria bacterium]
MLKRLLLIEPSATLRHAVKKLLDRQDYDAVEIADYAQALTTVTANKHAYAGVVLGWPAKTNQAADELFVTLTEHEFSNIGVVVLTHATDTNKHAWISKRSNTALVLWENHNEIIDTLDGLIQPQSQTELGIDSDALLAPELTSIKVLFVDDSPTIRTKYRRLLTQHGYDTDTASSVDEAFEKAVSNSYDIVISDYYMPEANGDALCQLLHDDERTASIATAIITGTYSDKAIISSLAAGATECMFKNEPNELFLARIEAMSRSLRAVRSLRNDHKYLEGILTSVGDGVYGVDCEGTITFINPAAKEILGYSKDERIIGQTAHTLLHNYYEDGTPNPPQQCMLQKAYQNGDQFRAWATSFLHKEGKFIPVECTVYPLTFDDKLHGSVVAFRDVSERRLLLDELRWQATHDPLTKLPNRSYFESQLTQEVKRLQRSSEHSALLYIDLDRFKFVNDTASHDVGDKFLIAVGKKLQSRLRAADTLARIGGDEFAIILRNVNPDAAFNAADKFRAVLENYRFNYGAKVYKVSVSIGVANINQQSSSAGEVLANADIACYIAKGKGRNCTHIFESGNDERTAMDIELGWSARLHDALNKNAFELHYQPILPLADIDEMALPEADELLWEQYCNTSHHNPPIYEVLLRLPDSRGQLVYPDAFMPTAERFNMMPKIDRWVIKEAISTMAELNAAGKSAVFSINISGQTLEQDNLAEYIDAVRREHNVMPGSFIFEITETSAISNLDSANRFIKTLHKLGYKFALDDFGSGFCSFSHLKFLSVDEIKIDGVFVQGMLHDTVDRAIINSIVQIAHSVGKTTVAEFVENADILRLLKESGVDYVQGFYIARPKQMLVDCNVGAAYSVAKKG